MSPTTTEPTTTGPNIDLLRRVLAHIEAHPETWYQAAWRCKAGKCFAGWAVELTGHQWLLLDAALTDERVEIEGRLDSVPAVTATAEVSTHVFSDAVRVADQSCNRSIWSYLRRDYIVFDGVQSAADVAQAQLGLTGGQAHVLFESDNTLNDLRAIIDELAVRPDADEDDLMEACALARQARMART